MTTDGFSFDLSAAEWRKGITDEKILLEALAVRLEQALPSLTTVNRSFSLFSSRKPVRSIAVRFDDAEYSLTNEPTGIHAQLGKVVRGIRLKTENLPFPQWLERLSKDLESYAAGNSEARDTLERFLLGD